MSAMLPGATDIDGDPVSYALGSQAANGIAAVHPDGSFTYTPGANFNGSDSFGFTVADGQGSNTYTYAITVNAVNDVPTRSTARTALTRTKSCRRCYPEQSRSTATR